jgi:hypothetical protein
MPSEAHEIITRKEANAAGLTRYFTGKPCKRGHVVERRVDTGDCAECVNQRSRRWRAANLDAELARSRKYRSTHPKAT